MNRRFFGIALLLLVVGFYAFGTGFDFFFRLLYVLLLVIGIGFVWAWLNLRGIALQLTRDASRGQVGGYLLGQVSIVNHTILPKSWLEVAEATGPSADISGRGLALMRQQTRSWRIQTYLAKRGVYYSRQVRLISQDPFGLFRLRREFDDPNPYIVFPAVEPLPDLDVRFAGLPSDGKTTRHWEQITTDVASIRGYVEGDSMRRIHWPYTARMNELMVKEFDLGISAESWVLLDMHHTSQFGMDLDEIDNTEELSVTVAASIVDQLINHSIRVGMASNGDLEHIIRPDTGPEHLGRLMETFSEVRAFGQRSFQDFVYGIGAYLNRCNSLTVVTSSVETEWVGALVGLLRYGVEVSVVLVDRSSFGSSTDMTSLMETLNMNMIPTYLVRKGDGLNDVLKSPVCDIYSSWVSGVTGNIE